MNKTPSAIRVLLADDHELFREGFNVLINKEPRVSLVAQASNGEELLQQAHSLQPDVVITDIKMPRLDGIEVMKRLSIELSHIGVIALTNYDDDALIVEMLEAGAKGYLLKSASKNEIIEAIQTVYKDNSYFCSRTNLKLAQLIANSSFNPYKRQRLVEFNNRERAVIRLVCEECTNEEIAKKLFLSKRTIESYRETILEKMGAKNVAGLVVYAIKNGLYKP